MGLILVFRLYLLGNAVEGLVRFLPRQFFLLVLVHFYHLTDSMSRTGTLYS